MQTASPAPSSFAGSMARRRLDVAAHDRLHVPPLLPPQPTAAGNFQTKGIKPVFSGRNGRLNDRGFPPQPHHSNRHDRESAAPPGLHLNRFPPARAYTCRTPKLTSFGHRIPEATPESLTTTTTDQNTSYCLHSASFMLTYKIDPFPGNIVQITTKDRDDIHAD